MIRDWFRGKGRKGQKKRDGRPNQCTIYACVEMSP
jgi:hypothetical protein